MQNFKMWRQMQYALHLINHVSIVLIAMVYLYIAYRLNFKDTALHMILTTIGFQFLMAEALISHYPINLFTKKYSRRTKTKIHGVLMFVGGLMGLYGSYIKFMQVEGPHFTSLHGKIGLAATFMCFASLVGGFVNYFQPKLAHRLYPPSEIKYRHNLFGMVTFTLGIAAIILSFQTKFFERHIGDSTYILRFSLYTLIVYLLTLISPMQSLLDKRKYRNK